MSRKNKREREYLAATGAGRIFLQETGARKFAYKISFYSFKNIIQMALCIHDRKITFILRRFFFGIFTSFFNFDFLIGGGEKNRYMDVTVS